MRERDRGQAAPLVHRRLRRRVEERDAVPEDVAALRLDEVGVLADREGRLGADRGQPGLELLEGVRMVGTQFVERRPALPLGRNVLTRLVADHALGRRLMALRVLNAARDADEARHARSLLMSLELLPMFAGLSF